MCSSTPLPFSPGPNRLPVPIIILKNKSLHSPCAQIHGYFHGSLFCPFISVLEHHTFLNWHEQDSIHVANGLCVPLQANLLAPSPTTVCHLCLNYPTSDVKLQQPFYQPLKQFFLHATTARLYSYHFYTSAVISFGCILNKHNPQKAIPIVF